MEIKKGKKSMLKYGAFLFIVTVVIFLLNRFNLFKDFTPQQIKEYVHSFGALAPIIYIIMFTIVPLTLFPDSVLAIAGGMCFGLFWGSIYTMIGALCGGTLSFYISRLIGKNFIKNILKKDLGELSSSIEEKGFFIILLLRLIPLFPYDIISYSAGLSNIRYRDFLLATIFGTIPGIIVFTNVGDKATDVGSTGFYISISLLVILLLASVGLKNKISLRRVEEMK
ncbi:putative membrane protein YdjX (TVP38/TMEM64 family) [Anaerosolibacter carboniphilus]|uniref:TVP38/TMEM64 family membrane protein n=1 Tax=Anaerosolibacter carboniphilus TaxID=1417629 RepID=A0A841KPW8_9FIRM|nr:putative membrane protein YdjX (TVP38/TMEM64 family) [Anaerosolibacter carboniphilus]